MELCKPEYIPYTCNGKSRAVSILTETDLVEEAVGLQFVECSTIS